MWSAVVISFTAALFLQSFNKIIMGYMNDENGCSTCTAPGSEKYEKFQIGMGKRRRTLYQYDYRSPSGVLFSTCAPTLEECRVRRDRAFGENQ